MQAGQIYRGSPGQHITHAAADACDMAAERAAEITLEFNDVRVPVFPGQTPDSVVEDWQRRMDVASEAYRASAAGQQAAKDSARRLQRKQVRHNVSMASLPCTFADARSAVSWLMLFADSADHTGVVGKDFDRVADVLEASGWKDGEACGLPEIEYETPDVLGRWIIGQAINMLRKGVPPHPVLMDKFATKFLALSH